jgi:hypothetical protein
MKKCLQTCKDLECPCPITECRLWIDYEEDFNCTEEAIRKNGNMTLREISKRLNVSFVRIKQIQDKAIAKITKHFPKQSF